MSWCSPARISSQVLRMSWYLSSSSLAPLWLAFAAPFFKVAYAVIISRGMRSWPMLKCSSERCVCAPHSLSLGTSTLPRLSVSVRMPITGVSIVTLMALFVLYEFLCLGFTPTWRHKRIQYDSPVRPGERSFAVRCFVFRHVELTFDPRADVFRAGCFRKTAVEHIFGDPSRGRHLSLEDVRLGGIEPPFVAQVGINLIRGRLRGEDEALICNA